VGPDGLRHRRRARRPPRVAVPSAHVERVGGASRHGRRSARDAPGGRGDGAVTRDTLEHGPCDRYARAPSESSERDVTGDAIATHTTLQEVLS
jgi:hypothetical protein